MQLHIYTNPLTLDRALRAEARRAGVVLRPPHYTLSQLIDQLYRLNGIRREGEPTSPLISGTFRALMVRKAICDAEGKAPGPGFVKEIAGTLRELTEAGLEPGDLKGITELGSTSISPALKEKLSRLHPIFENYCHLLKRANRVDRAGRDLKVLESLIIHFQKGTRPQLMEAVESVVIHDVYYLSIVQYGIISLLMRMAPQGGVVTNFTDSTNVEATHFIDFTWQRFVNDESLAESAIPEFASSSVKPGTLGKLRERVFASRGKSEEPLAPDETFQILSAPDSCREVEEVCQRVRQHLENGVLPHQIAILAKNWQNYTDFLKEMTNHYRFPLAFDRKIPLFHFPIIKTLFRLLDLAVSQFKREDLLSVLISVYLRPEGWLDDDIVGMVNESGYLDEQHSKLEDVLMRSLGQKPKKRSLKVGELISRVKDLKQKLECLALGNSLERETVFNEAGRPRSSKAIAQQLPLFSTLGESDPSASEPRSVPSPGRVRTFSGFVAHVRRLVIDLGFYQKLASLSATPLFVLQRDREALQVLFSILEEAGLLLEAWGEGPISFQTFLNLSTELVAGATLSEKSSNREAVLALSPVQALGLEIDRVFLLGFSEGEFPSLTWENSLLRDEDRGRLNPLIAVVLFSKFGGLLESSTLRKTLLTSVETSRQGPLEFFLVLECAQRQLTCSYPERDLEGEMLLPSVYLAEILRHFDKPSPEKSVVRRIPATLRSRDWTQVYDWSSLLKMILKVSASTPDALDLRLEELSPISEQLKSLDLDLGRLRHLAQVERGRKAHLMGLLSGDACLKNYYADLVHEGSLSDLLDLKTHKWSPTEFETMAQCPFVHFASAFLHLYPRDIPQYDLTPLTLGTLAHKILREFHSSELSRDPGQERKRIRWLIQKVLQAWENNTPNLNLGYWEVRRAELQAALEDYAGYAADSLNPEFENFSQEFRISESLSIGDLNLEIEGKPDWVRLQEPGNKIHSIDVVDFKYSADRPRLVALTKQENFGKTSFQLPLYLYLVWRHLAKQGRAVSSQLRLLGHYVVLRFPVLKQCTFEAGLEMFDPVLLGIKQQVQRIQRGIFHLDPLPGRCDVCNFGALCRFWTSGAGDALKAQRRLE